MTHNIRMINCENGCLGRSRFELGSQTKDGKQTWDVSCEAGQLGGCNGPSFDQLKELNRSIGRSHGAKRRNVVFPYEQLALSDSFRLMRVKTGKIK